MTMKVDIINAIQKGVTPLKTDSILIFVAEAVTMLTTPTGGVINPMFTIKMVIIPNHIPLKPAAITRG